MDLNYILLWTVGMTSLLWLVRFVSHRTRETRGWIVVAATALGLVAAGLVFFPHRAGLVAGAFWLLFMIAPVLAARLRQRLTLKQEYGRARRLLRWTQWLHPFGGWREQGEILHALELVDRGATEQARAILDRYRASDTALARMAMVLCFRVENQWDELLAWCRARDLDPLVTRDVSILTSAIRALGETGDLNGLLMLLDRHARHLSAAHMAMVSNMCSLTALAFCGRRTAVEGLFQGQLRDYPADVKSFWLATAGLAAGDRDHPRQVLEDLRLSGRMLTRRAAEYRLQRPLADPAVVLTGAARQILDRLETESLAERQYGGFAAGIRGFRPYATYALLLVNVAVFLLEVAAGGSEKNEVLLRLGALYVPAVLAGQWWRIPASTVLHFGYLHLLLNMFGLYLLGPYLESRLGRVRYVLAYLLIGSGAAGASVLLARLHLIPANGLCVGASGGILGLVGGAAAVLVRGWREQRLQSLKRNLRSIGLVIGLQMLFDFLTPQISNTVHISGILLGFLIVWFLPLRLPGPVRPADADGGAE